MDKTTLEIAISEHLYLRTLKESDITDSYVQALNDKERVKYMTSLSQRVSYSDIAQYVSENNNNPGHLLFGIFEEDILLGTCRLHDIDRQESTAHLGIFIFNSDPDKKGLGTLVVIRISDFAFNVLGLETVQAGIFIENIPSVRAFSKAGFSVFDHAQYDGKPYQKWIRRRAE